MKLKLNGKNGNGNGNGNGKNGALLKIGLLALAILLVGVLLYRQFDRFRGPRQEVWVAATSLAPGTLISTDVLERVAMRASNLPEDTLAELEMIEGQQVARPVEEGEPFRQGDVQPPARPRQQQAASLAELLPEGRVLLRVRAALDTVIMSELRFGDRFELVGMTGDGRGVDAEAAVIASDAFFLAWIDPALLAGNGGGGNGGDRESGGLLADLVTMPPRGGGGGAAAGGASTMLLALHPTDVLPVAQAQSAGTQLHVVLHGRQEVESGEMIALPGSRSGSVELITGGRRERVPVS